MNRPEEKRNTPSTGRSTIEPKEGEPRRNTPIPGETLLSSSLGRESAKHPPAKDSVYPRNKLLRPQCDQSSHLYIVFLSSSCFVIY